MTNKLRPPARQTPYDRMTTSNANFLCVGHTYQRHSPSPSPNPSQNPNRSRKPESTGGAAGGNAADILQLADFCPCLRFDVPNKY
ncbi:hypothetical protein AWZ03_010417 [Drosophila navojoa]|uniref:Uncharacterized protein n=1 Tax=Drosophila navojoa TaxID=7232 RepID=A0A484B4D5_DRONA|nr:hypothetical protein AWZ03_010417 [Drosophila navojoa]